MPLPSIKTYWLCWVGVVAALVITKFVARACGVEGLEGWLILGYVALIWIPTVVMGNLEHEPLRERIAVLRAVRPKRPLFDGWWTHLRILFADETLGDAEVVRLRRRQIDFLKFTLAAAIPFPLVGIILAYQ